MIHKAQETMTRKVVTILWDAPLIEAYKIMKEKRIRHLPVVKTNQSEVVGLLSDRDLQRAMSSQASHDHVVPMETVQFPHGSKVRDFMNWPVMTVDRKQEIQSVAKLMIKEKISSLIVTDKTEMVGIITTEDMLRLLDHLLSEGAPQRSMGIDSFFDEAWISPNTLI